jgi:hypothetical protein
MALAWRMADLGVDEAKAAIKASIREVQMPDWARVDWSGNDLNVRIDKMGKSTFVMGLRPDGAGSRIVEVKRKVAFAHRIFSSDVERFVDKALRGAGFSRV